MPRGGTPAERLSTSSDGALKKDVKPTKIIKSSDSPLGKRQPNNTNIRANFVGRDVEVRLKNSKIINGVCADPGFGSVIKLCNAYVAPGAGFENVVFPKNMHYNELELPIEDVVEITAHLGNPKKRFTTDAEYSVNQKSSEENYKLVEWDGGEPTETFDSTDSRGGWSIEDMFKKNQALGVQTTYKDDLTQYTTCEPIGSEEDRARATKIAREIETNVKSKHLAFLENDDEERDLDKETELPDGVEPPPSKAEEPEESKVVEDSTSPEAENPKKTTFSFNPDAPAFVPQTFTPSAPSVAVTPIPQQPPPMPLLSQPINNNGHQGYIVTPGLGMQQNNGVITQTYIPQPIAMMQLYNQSIMNGAQQQQMQPIPSLIQTHPQNLIIRSGGGANEYQNAYIQTNPGGAIQLQQMPMYRLPMQAQQPQQQHPQQQQQQQMTLYQIQPQVSMPQQQQQQHFQPRVSHHSSGGGNHAGGGPRPRRNNNHGNNSWQQSQHQMVQSIPGHLQANQPRYQQIQQNQVFLPQISQMNQVYINPNAAITSSNTNNINYSNLAPINMFPQYPQPYQRIENGMMALQGGGQLPQNAVMVGPNMIMQQQTMQQHHQGGNHIVHSQPQTPAPAGNQGSSSPMHFPPNVNVPPPQIIQKKISATLLQNNPQQQQYVMHNNTPVVISSNHSQIYLMHPPPSPSQQGTTPPISTYIMMPRPSTPNLSNNHTLQYSYHPAYSTATTQRFIPYGQQYEQRSTTSTSTSTSTSQIGRQSS